MEPSTDAPTAGMFAARCVLRGALALLAVAALVLAFSDELTTLAAIVSILAVGVMVDDALF